MQSLALWCFFQSPLIIGADLCSLDEGSEALLKNPDLIAINQDPECRSCYRLTCQCSPDAFTLVKPLAGGEYAIGIFNFGESPVQTGFPFWDMGLTFSQALRFWDCLEHKDCGVFQESFSVAIPAHGCRIYRCSLEKTN